ncbi:hypothetical protein GGI04_001720 [Coemansia thaxteri]|nr:hypothetical protein GGI04_001720 [Coemansia thaxteri]
MLGDPPLSPSDLAMSEAVPVKKRRGPRIGPRSKDLVVISDDCIESMQVDDDRSECSSASTAGESSAVGTSFSRPARPSRGPARPVGAAKTAAVKSQTKHYFPLVAEEREHKGMEVFNETPLVADAESDTRDDLPCRTLDDFVVFDEANANIFADLDDVGEEGTEVTIAGDVEPVKSSDLDNYINWDDSDDEGDEGDETCTLGGSTRASGKSTPRPCATDMESPDTGLTQRIRLSAIFCYETFLTMNGETEIWVQTCFGWYKLLNPHPSYAAIYSKLYKAVYMAHQAVRRAKTEPNLPMSRFISDLRAQSPNDILSRLTPITEGDFRKYRDWIGSEIEILTNSTEQDELLATPLIRSIRREGGGTGKAKRAAPSSSQARRTSSGGRVRASDKTALSGEPKNENPACITPLVASIAQGLYARRLLNVSNFDSKFTSSASSETELKEADAWRKRYTQATKAKTADKFKGRLEMADLEAHISLDKFKVSRVEFNEQALLPEEGDGVARYSEAGVMSTATSTSGPRDITVRVGDVVLVRAPELPRDAILDSLWDNAVSGDSKAQRGAIVNADRHFVCAVQVISISHTQERSAQTSTFHGRLLIPGRDTVMQEVAMANEFFLVDSCQTYAFVTSLCGKIGIPFIASKAYIDIGKWVDARRLFCRFWYDLSSAAFEDVNSHVQATDGYLPMWCRSCERTAKEPAPKLGRRIAGSACSSISDVGGASVTEPLVSTQIAPNRCADFVPTVTVGGVDYHTHDVVYMPSDQPNQPFAIGSIVRFFRGPPTTSTKDGPVRILKADIQILKRMRVLPVEHRPQEENSAYDDERHLYWTPLIWEVDVLSFRGKCWVAHPEDIKGGLTAYKDTDVNAFYAKYKGTKAYPGGKDDWIELKPPFEASTLNKEAEGGVKDERASMPACCPICKRERRERTRLLERFLDLPVDGAISSRASGDEPVSFARGQQPLRALDLFSGCGGLTQGLDQSGIVKTMWSVEYMLSAGYTFSKNHPDAQVYNQCSNLLLDSAIRTHRGETIKPLVNQFDGKQLPPMPQPGDVDFIYCGPPCQGFSRCNRFIKADDIKTSLVANALSYVDFYRPTYFLLENVRGLLTYRLGGFQIGPGKVGGGIEMGMLKFILRTLTTMGYQAKFYVLQAGNYGLAQSRRRIFIWACKRGCRLPGVPRPMTTFGKSSQTNVCLPDGTTYAPFAYLSGNAPHHAITVKDAIGDLPKFEFINPQKRYPDPLQDSRPPEWLQYIAVDNQSTDIPGDLDGQLGYVGSMEMSYTSPPLSEFQRLRRRKEQVCVPGSTKNCDELVETLYNHACRKFNAENVERVCRVELQGGKDHHTLPEKLRPWCLSNEKSAAARHNGWKGLFGRLEPEGSFGTALTTMEPMNKSGTVLLYDQRRVLTVRECARAQGFPDTFRFYSINEKSTKDMYRQIGNAVPPPLAYALSLELRDALFQDFVAHAPDSVLAADVNAGEQSDDFADVFCIDLATSTRSLRISEPGVLASLPTCP